MRAADQLPGSQFPYPDLALFVPADDDLTPVQFASGYRGDRTVEHPVVPAPLAGVHIKCLDSAADVPDDDRVSRVCHRFGESDRGERFFWAQLEPARLACRRVPYLDPLLGDVALRVQPGGHKRSASRCLDHGGGKRVERGHPAGGDRLPERHEAA